MRRLRTGSIVSAMYLFERAGGSGSFAGLTGAAVRSVLGTSGSLTISGVAWRISLNGWVTYTQMQYAKEERASGGYCLTRFDVRDTKQGSRTRIGGMGCGVWGQGDNE